MRFHVKLREVVREGERERRGATKLFGASQEFCVCAWSCGSSTSASGNTNAQRLTFDFYYEWPGETVKPVNSCITCSDWGRDEGGGGGKTKTKMYGIPDIAMCQNK